MPLPALSASELLLALARGLFVAGVLSAFGAALLLAALAPPSLRRIKGAETASIEACLIGVVRYSLLAASLAGVAWLVAEARHMADATSLGEALAMAPAVLLETRFGQTLALQFLMLGAAAAALAVGHRGGAIAAACFSGLACVLEAGHSHAFAMARGPLLLSQGLHLLAAGAWLGGLLPLRIVIARAPLDEAAAIARRFSALGIVAVGVIAATATIQGIALAGGTAGLFGTAYGLMLLVKASLFAIMVALAAWNRSRLRPGLLSPEGERYRAELTRNISVETALGLCVVLVAGLMSGLEPGMHHMHG